MKKMLILLLLLSGCVEVKKMNENINESSVAIQTNKAAIDANTASINQNAQAIQTSTDVIQKSSKALQLLSEFSPLLFFVVVVFVFGPFFLLLLFMQRLDKKLDRFLSKRKR